VLWIHALAHILVGEPAFHSGSRPRSGFAGICAQSMIPKKAARDLSGGGYRFPEKIMLQQ